MGLTEAALARAAELAQRFSIIAISPRIGAWYRVVVEGYGYAGRLASIRSLEAPILAGAPLAGLARRISGLAVPLVDPIAAAVQQAERAPLPAFVAPPKKRNSGLPEAVRRLLSG